MSGKLKKQRALDLLRSLTPDELQSVLSNFQLGTPTTSYANVEQLLPKMCPACGSINHIKKGRNNIGLTIFRCKDCGRKFNILSETPLEKTPYAWNIWVVVLEKMLTNQSIEQTHKYLLRNHLLDNIDISTVSMMRQKLRNGFIYMPLPELKGIIQCDEKHFHESQKGILLIVRSLKTAFH